MQRLHQNIVCAELLKLLQQMRLAMTTEYDHPRRPGLALPPALQRSENLEPVHLRHPQIAQHRRRFRPDCSRMKGAEHRHLSEGPRSRLRAVSLAGSAVRRRLGYHGRLKDGVGGKKVYRLDALVNGTIFYCEPGVRSSGHGGIWDAGHRPSDTASRCGHRRRRLVIRRYRSCRGCQQLPNRKRSLCV